MKGKCKRKNTCKYSVLLTASGKGTTQRICGYLLTTGRPRESDA